MTEKTKKINNSLQNHNTESKERQRKSHQKKSWTQVLRKGSSFCSKYGTLVLLLYLAAIYLLN